jgi:hypothetical protein
MRATIEAGLAATLDARLVKELLDAHEEAKRNFYLGGLRLSAVEGGRFCEAAFRLLQQIAYGTFDRIGASLDTEKLIRELPKLPPASHKDSIRIHIPRALRVIYDIRNKRDTAHLGDGIDPNVQDATLVVANVDWVLAEFVRLYHNVSANDAQKMIEGLVTRTAPAIQDFNGFLKVLRPDLAASDRMVLLLYQRGADGATYEQLSDWARPSMRRNLKRTLATLVDDKAYAHEANGIYKITALGQKHVERERLFEVV